MSKPHVHVAVLGSAEDGKSTVTVALSRAAAELWSEKGPKTVDTGRPIPAGIMEQGPSERTKARAAITYEELVFGGEWKGQAYVRTIAPGVAWIEGLLRVYCVQDLPAHEWFYRCFNAGIHAAEVALLVVSAERSVRPSTFDVLHIAKAMGVKRVLVCINQIDLQPDAELLAVTEYEVREALATCGFDGNEAPVFFTNALAAVRGEEASLEAFRLLLHALEALPHEHSRLVEAPFRVTARRLYWRSSVKLPNVFGVESVVERGRIREGEHVVWMHGNEVGAAKVRRIEVCGEKREEAFAGEFAWIGVADVGGRGAHPTNLGASKPSQGPGEFLLDWKVTKRTDLLHRGSVLFAPGKISQALQVYGRFRRLLPKRFLRATEPGSVLVLGTHSTLVPAKVLSVFDAVTGDFDARGSLHLGFRWPRFVEVGEELPAYTTGVLFGTFRIEQIATKTEHEVLPYEFNGKLKISGME